MKKTFAILGILLVFLFGAFAQTPDDANEGSRLEYDSANSIMRFKWWGRSGRTYFIQHSDNLLNPWQWVPAVESGNNSIKEWGFTTTGDKFFVRLKYSDQATTDPEGDDFDMDGVPNLYEVQHGNNPFAIEDSDNDGLPDGWLDVHAGTFAIYPPSRLTASISRNQTAPGKIYLNNDTATAVNYSVAVSANTGPSYSVQDSVTGSAVYSWEDISTTGTLLPTISGADDLTATITLSGFSFPFYGQTFSAVSVSSNGCLMFGEANSSYSNIALPSTSAPSNLIALFWDDLNPGTSGDIYYKEESNRLIVQYQNVAKFSGNGEYTFQAVLYSDGRIEIRYQTMTGLLNSATIGIQNSDRSLGLTASSDAAYVSNSMAVTFSPTSEFFSILPTSGTVAPHSRVTLDGLFHSLQLPFGDYTANVAITHNGGAGSPLNLTANLNVKNVPTVISIISPTNQSNILQGQTVSITANATDVDTQIAKVEFFDNGVKLGEDLNSPYQYSWTPADASSHVLTAKSTDIYGDSTTSAGIPIQVLPDADQDKMDDIWEAAHGLDITKNDAMEDLDGDRVPNIFEYYRETLPDDATSYPAVDFVVDPATGNASTTDNIYSTIGEAITKANESVWNAQTSQYDRPNAWAVIEVKSGIYQEEVNISDMPVLMLAELGSTQGPVELRSPYEYGARLNATCALDGFVITHRIGVEGSGVYSYASGSNNPARALTNCIIKGNKAAYGGGIYNDGNSILRIAHCTIIGNQASGLGQAIYNAYNSKIDLANSIIWDNTGAAPSAIYQDTYAPAGAFTGGTTSMIQGGEQGGINENPLLNASGYLLSNSPAINRTATLLAKASKVDIHGERRDQVGTPDLGADEYRDDNGVNDGDGLPDWAELTGASGPTDDADGDGVSNLTEYLAGMNPRWNDTDRDGVTDGAEVNTYSSNPLSYDSDSDGLADGAEIAAGTGITNPDSDGDSIPDGKEIQLGTNPLSADSDSDGMPDGWEVANSLNPLVNDAAQDPDKDGLTNIQEYTHGTNPRNFDTDGDLLSDGWEVAYGLNPLVANSATADTDGDGLKDFQEMVYGTNPTLADTDGDGASDWQEVNQGSLPNDPSDNGLPPSEEEKLTVKIIVGDPSGSHSERWRVAVKDLDTGNIILNHQSPAFGELSSDESSTFSQFRKGHSYELNLIHVGTDPQKVASDPDGSFYPDYDWALEVSTQDADGQFTDVRGGTKFAAIDPWDPQSQTVASTIPLLVARNELTYPWEGQADRTQQYENQIASKRVMIIPIDLCVDNVSDTDEETVGVYIPINGDNDNGSLVTNGFAATPDLDVAPIANGDDDLKSLKIKGSLASIPVFTVKLTANQSQTGGSVKIWKDREKSEQVTLPAQFSGSNIPSELFVEGVHESGAVKDITLTATVLLAGQELGSDTVKVSVTPVINSVTITPGRVVTLDTQLTTVNQQANLDPPGFRFQAEIEAKNLSGGPRLIQNITEFWGTATHTAASGRGPAYMVLGNGSIPLLDCPSNPNSLEEIFYPFDGGEIVGTVYKVKTTDNPSFAHAPGRVSQIADVNGKTGFKMYTVWQFEDNTLRVIALSQWHIYWHYNYTFEPTDPENPLNGIYTLAVQPDSIVAVDSISNTNEQPDVLTGPSANESNPDWQE